MTTSEIKQAEPVAVDHSGLIKRIDTAIERVTKGYGLMTIPADPRSDVDLVLSECKALLQGENPPFWAKDFHPTPAVAVNEQMLITLKLIRGKHACGALNLPEGDFERVDNAIRAADAAKKGGV